MTLSVLRAGTDMNTIQSIVKLNPFDNMRKDIYGN